MIYAVDRRLQPSRVSPGATLGPNATIIAWVTVGAEALIGPARWSPATGLAPFIVAGMPLPATGGVCDDGAGAGR